METTALNQRPARVLAVDDDATFRDVVGKLVRAAGEMVVAGEADSGELAVQLVEQLRPDLVLMDVRMPGMGGVRAARTIKTAHPSIVVVLVSTARPEDLGTDADGCPADARIWKSDLRPSLLAQLWERHQPPREDGASSET